MSLARRLAAEFLGTALLLVAVVGSGIMAERLAGGNMAVALLANAIATGAALVVLITIFAPLSGAHFNPCVTLYAALSRDTAWGTATLYMSVQIAAAVAGATRRATSSPTGRLPAENKSDRPEPGVANVVLEGFVIVLTCRLEPQPIYDTTVPQASSPRSGLSRNDTQA